MKKKARFWPSLGCFCNFLDRISSFEDVQKMIWWLWLGLLFWKVIVGILYGEWKSFGIVL